MMRPENKEILITRTKSFFWRLGAYVVVAILNFIAENIGLFELPPLIVMLVALVCGEVTKYLNMNLPKLKRRKEEA